MIVKNRFFLSKNTKIDERTTRKLIKCFAADLTVSEAAKKTGLSIRSINPFYIKLRKILYKNRTIFVPLYMTQKILRLYWVHEIIMNTLVKKFGRNKNMKIRNDYIIFENPLNHKKEKEKALESAQRELNKMSKEEIIDFMKLGNKNALNQLIKDSDSFHDYRTNYLKKGSSLKYHIENSFESRYRYVIGVYICNGKDLPIKYKKIRGASMIYEVDTKVSRHKDAFSRCKKEVTSRIYKDLINWIIHNPIGR
ncbi:MAG: hypothetical protein KAS59_08880 [Alphaproteobacteria bacterium]|nr:hypothetical protein [Alphaproteobacteria bacterium]